MITINKLILYNNNDNIKEYSFKKNTIIIGNNNSGKTKFFELIDYILGSSSENILLSLSIEGIKFAELELLKNNTSYFFKRSLINKSECFFKYDTTYNPCNLEVYKQEINQLLSINQNYRDIYSTVFNENMSYRIFSFLNKIETNKKSVSVSLFSSSENFIFRNRYIMNFIFNYKNIVNIAEHIKVKENLEKKSESIEKNKLYFEFIKTKLAEIYDTLSIKYKDDNLLDHNIIKKITNYYEEVQYDFDDYAYYLAKLNAIDNQLKEYKFINQQLKFMNDKHHDSINLLEQFNSIIKNSNYKEYTKDILSKVEKFKDKITINTLLDTKKIINQLEKQRKEILNLVKNINTSYKPNNFVDIAKNIELAKKYIEILNQTKEINNDDIKKQIRELKKEIKELEYSFDDELLIEFNNDLTNTYINLSNNISCVAADKNIPDLMLEFEHLKNKLRFVKKNSDNNLVDNHFDPGSDARYIILRIISHLCMFKLIQKHFDGLPVLPILLIDGLDHTIDSKSINPFINDFIKIIAENNIQTISFYKNEYNIKSNDDIEIINFNKEPNGGFNPWLEK